ncbi:MAG: ABC transporter permease [Treponema sp.]|jgi:simple sugar transport system permease protein|nr:ABC transporter permease [Treponema sp.]
MMTDKASPALAACPRLGMRKSILIRLRAATGTLLIICLSLLFLILLALLLSKTPGRTLYYFFLGPLRNVYSFGNMLNSAIPLILGGIGVSIAMRAGRFNLGGEGQIYAGAFVTTALALALSHWGIAGAVMALLAGVFFSGFASGLSGLFKARWDASELITSFLISNVLILLTNYLVTGPFLDPATNLQSTRKIPEVFHLPLILRPSNLSAALFVALAAALLAQLFLTRTRRGYEIRAAGANEMFARYGGINTKVNTTAVMFLSGAFYGLAGALAVYGTYYGTVKEFSSGMGWNGLAAALIARFRPPALIPAGIFFAWINSGARIAMQNSDMSFETVAIVQAVVFFLVTSMSLRNIFGGKEGR